MHPVFETCCIRLKDYVGIRGWLKHGKKAPLKAAQLTIVALVGYIMSKENFKAGRTSAQVLEDLMREIQGTDRLVPWIPTKKYMPKR